MQKKKKKINKEQKYSEKKPLIQPVLMSIYK